MNIFKELISVFYVPGHKKRAIIELEEARCALLSSQTNYDYAVTNLAYNQQRVDRLTRIVQDIEAFESHNNDGKQHPLCRQVESNVGVVNSGPSESVAIPLHERRSLSGVRQSR